MKILVLVGLLLSVSNAHALCRFHYVIQDDKIISSEFKCDHARVLPKDHLPTVRFVEPLPKPVEIVVIPKDPKPKKQHPPTNRVELDRLLQEINDFNRKTIDDVLESTECTVSVLEDGSRFWQCLKPE